MYVSFFSLSKKPFELLPNPDFLFLGEAHRKALTFLEYGLLEHTGFILFTGEVGTGKTTIIRRLLNKIPQDVALARLFNTQVDSTQMLRMVNADFGIPGASGDKPELLRQLNEFLIDQYAAGRRSILIIDEAQNLGPEQLEEIRMLSNLETAHAKLLQIILVGQPELRDKLGGPDLIQLRQRIMVHCHLSPLTSREVESYIFHRLAQAGNHAAVAWEEGVMGVIHAATRGIPRLVNILCHYILLDAFSRNVRTVSRDDVNGILGHLDFETQFWPPVRDNTPGNSGPPVRAAAAENGIAAMEAALKQIGVTMDRMHDCIGLLQQVLVAASRLVATALQAGNGTAGQGNAVPCARKRRAVSIPPTRRINGRTNGRGNGRSNGRKP